MNTDTQSARVISSPDGKQWIVVAEWFGQSRTVHGPCDLFEAVRFRAALEQAST
jgi:hypothetical protein